MIGDTSGGPSQAAGQQNPAIVAIGASAGGIQALQAFFTKLPGNTGAAYVIVMHLDPGHRSVPPNRQLRIIDHEISAIPFDAPAGRRNVIDRFLQSISEHLGDGLAIILSGANSDGAKSQGTRKPPDRKGHSRIRRRSKAIPL